MIDGEVGRRLSIPSHARPLLSLRTVATVFASEAPLEKSLLAVSMPATVSRSHARPVLRATGKVTQLSAFQLPRATALVIGAAAHVVDVPPRSPQLSFFFSNARIQGPLSPPVLHLQALPPVLSVRPVCPPTLSFFFSHTRVRPPRRPFWHLESMPTVCAIAPGR
jgi:hypothetical protein